MIKFGLTILTMKILGMVMVKIGLTILTIETQFWPNDQKSWSSDPPPLNGNVHIDAPLLLDTPKYYHFAFKFLK
jgi:hypothetical protein